MGYVKIGVAATLSPDKEVTREIPLFVLEEDRDAIRTHEEEVTHDYMRTLARRFGEYMKNRQEPPKEATA